MKTTVTSHKDVFVKMIFIFGSLLSFFGRYCTSRRQEIRQSCFRRKIKIAATYLPKLVGMCYLWDMTCIIVFHNCLWTIQMNKMIHYTDNYIILFIFWWPEAHRKEEDKALLAECLGHVIGMRHFRHYIAGTPGEKVRIEWAIQSKYIL